MGYEVPAIRLTDRERKFCDEWVGFGREKGSATQAALRAGYSPKTAGVTAAKMLQRLRRGGHPMMAAYIEQLRAKQDKERCLRRGFIAEQLHRMVARDVIGFEKNRVVVSSLEDVPTDLRRCVDGFKVRQFMDPETGAVTSQTIEVKLSPLASAVDMALKVRGMYEKDNKQKPGAQVAVVNWGDLFIPQVEGPDPIEVRIGREEGPVETDDA